MRDRVNQLRKEVCGLFEDCSDSNVVHQMSLVDNLQHLSIDHLFQDQIDATLRSIHGGCGGFSSLHEVALRFRLLRTHGLWVSPGRYCIYMCACIYITHIIGMTNLYHV